MRYFQLQTSTDKLLNEVRMAPSNLSQFLQTPLAKSMKAGFEAELVFKGGNEGRSGDYESEWEYDYDQDERVRSIDDIIEFFSSGEHADMSYNGQRARRLREQMREEYNEWLFEKLSEDFAENETSVVKEWIENNDWDEDDELETVLRDDMDLSAEEVEAAIAAGNKYGSKITSSKEQRDVREQDEAYDNFLTAMKVVEEKLDAKVEEEIEDQGSAWESAREEYEQDYMDNYDEGDWLESRGITSAIDAANEWDLSWPHMIDTNEGNDGEFNEEYAEGLAQSLEDNLGVDTKVSSGYHSARRDESTWIFEPDSSLSADDSDDMPVEIVSPPMSLPDAIATLPLFFEWARRNGAYANKSTGFHMSVSLPDHKQENIDFTKLVLFLGDKYVLDTFNRSASLYCKSAFSKIQQQAKEINIPAAFDQMRSGLSQLASKSLANASGFGKYTSINPKQNYIEFRSAGGSDYFADMTTIQNTLLRYAYATSIAGEPKLERQEYAKKLYKLLASTQPAGSDIVELFSKYSGGELSRDALVSRLKMLQVTRDQKNRDPVADLIPANDVRNTATGPNQSWELFNVSTGEVGNTIFHAPTREAATIDARRYFARIGSSGEGWQLRLARDQQASDIPDWPFPERSPP